MMGISLRGILLGLMSLCLAMSIAGAETTEAKKPKPKPTPKPTPTPQPTIKTIDEFNANLIKNGIAWKHGPDDRYYPSFYVGFAPRIEEANRIHFHLSRGNQARLTAQIDEQAVLTYLYSLKARSNTYKAIAKTGVAVPVTHKQVDFFHDIVSSDVYNVLPTIEAFEKGQLSREQFYQSSLNVLKALNPGRVFSIRIDMRETALKWRDSELRELAKKIGSSDIAAINASLAKNPKTAILATNNLLLGRVNAFILNDTQRQKLAALTAASVTSPGSDDAFVTSTVDFLNDVTAGRFSFKIVDNGRSRRALQCHSSGACDLVYTEFTAIYPNGSVLESAKDREGNMIPDIQEKGVMNFIERGYHDVDHIRTENYYGWIPKMDYTMSGNGIHNPAVRTYLKRDQYKYLHDLLGVPIDDKELWIVSRGKVSHGCTRLAAGHLMEVRQVFPSNPKQMTKVYYTGNASTDYDLFDIDADGQLEVMGVEYYIEYELESEDGDGYRESKKLRDESFNRDAFYARLYGRGQYTVSGDKYYFTNPYISYFSKAKPKDQRAKPFSVQFQGNFPLYEQAYEKDKLQFFDLPTLKLSSLAGNSNNKSNRSHQVARIFGRVAACGPFKSEFPLCNEAEFKQELRSLIPTIQQ